MLKKIKLDIESVITNLDDLGVPDGDPEINRTSHVGAMRTSNDETVFSYKESNENGSISCSVTVRGESVSVRREGAICSVMVFDTGEPYKTVYSIPPYSFDMVITTKKLEISLSERGGKIDILYTMDVGGAKKSTRMRITASEVQIK